MAERHPRSARVLDPAYHSGLEDLPEAELRTKHAECLELETEVSYVRRLAQARTEILQAELDRRRDGGSIADLIARLPEILADKGPRTAAANARVPEILAPSMSISWSRGTEYLIADDTLVNLPTLTEDELRETIDALHELEGEVSTTRRQLHGVIDAIEDVLGPRLTDAEA